MTEPLRILIVEDNPADAELMESQLRSDGLDLTTRRVELSDEFVRALREFDPNIVLSDYWLPRFNGMEALRLTQEHASHVPVIIITGSINEVVAVDCMKAGAADYILKDRTARLGQAVRAALEKQRVTNEMDRAIAALRLDAAILRNLAEGIALISQDDRTIKFANPRYERLFGYSPGEMIGKSLASIAAPGLKTPDETAAEIESCLMETGEWHGEIENIRKDGSRFWSFAHISLFDHPELGHVAIAVHTDITERKLAEMTLRESEARFTRIFHASPMSIAITRLSDNTFVNVNEAWLKATGLTHEEAIGRNPIGLNLWADPAERERLVATLRSGSTVQGFEFRLRRTSDEIRDHLLSAEIITLSGEACMLSIATDITERRQAQTRLAEQFEELRRWHEVTVGREGRIIELKREVNELLTKAGQPPRYGSALEKDE